MSKRIIVWTPTLVVLLAGMAALWRQPSLPWHDLAFAAVMLLWTIIRALSVPPLPATEKRAATAIDMCLLAAVSMGMLGLPVVALATPILDWARYAVYGPVAGLGCGLALAGLWIFRRAHVDLGRNWSPTLELREGHRIIQTGIYARVRHPMYLAIILLTLA